MNTFIRVGVLTLAVVLAAAWAGPARAGKATNLDEAIANKTPDISYAVRQLCKDDAAVGTLSFRVQIGTKEEPRFRVGALPSHDALGCQARATGTGLPCGVPEVETPRIRGFARSFRRRGGRFPCASSLDKPNSRVGIPRFPPGAPRRVSSLPSPLDI